MKKIFVVLAMITSLTVSVFAENYKLTDYLGYNDKSITVLPKYENLLTGRGVYPEFPLLEEVELKPYKKNIKTDRSVFSKKKRDIDSSFYILGELPIPLAGVNSCYKYIMYEKNQYVKVGDEWYTDADRAKNLYRGVVTYFEHYHPNSCSNFGFLNIEKLYENPNKVYTIYSQEKAYKTIVDDLKEMSSNGFVNKTKSSYTVVIKQGDKISVRVWNK